MKNTNKYTERKNLVKVGPNPGKNSILNMYRVANSTKYYGVVRFNNYAYSFMATERVFRATVYGFKGTVEELDMISQAIQNHMRPNREPACDGNDIKSPTWNARYFYNFLSKGLMIYKAPSTDKEEKYLGYVTSHAFVAFKKDNDVVVLYKNVKYIFSVNKFNKKPSTGTDEAKLRNIVLKLIYNVDKQVADALAQDSLENVSEEVDDFEGAFD